MTTGFSNWTKRDHRAFVYACERHGRSNKAVVFAEVAETAGKPMDEVQRYYDTFFERCVAS